MCVSKEHLRCWLISRHNSNTSYDAYKQQGNPDKDDEDIAMDFLESLWIRQGMVTLCGVIF
jgi:hypothetical protein